MPNESLIQQLIDVSDDSVDVEIKELSTFISRPLIHCGITKGTNE